MAQNIYDDAAFFAGYSQLPRSVHGLSGAAEWPSLRRMLPDVGGRRVVDLGCGYGWFCRWAVDAGAVAVVGLDLSARMLAKAAADTDDDRIMYARQDLEAVDLPVAAFDLAFSSLALHYLVDLEQLLVAVHRCLVPGGRFVFSVEHPIYTAPSRPGFVEGPDGGATWPLDQYLVEGPRTTDWLAPGVVKQHRTIATYVRLLGAAGFVLDDLDEWGPSAAQVDEHPEWSVEQDRPPFLLVAVRRA